MKKRIVFCLLALLTGIGSVYADITIKAKIPAEWTVFIEANSGYHIYIQLYKPTNVVIGRYTADHDGGDWYSYTYTGEETLQYAIFICHNDIGTNKWPSEKHYQTTNVTELTSDKCVAITDNTTSNSKSTWSNSDCPSPLLYDGSTPLYLNAAAVNFWCNSGAIQKATFTKDDNTTEVVIGEVVVEGIYSFTPSEGDYKAVVFSRHNPEGGAQWNATGKISLYDAGASNYISEFAQNSVVVTWDTYSPPAPTVSFVSLGATIGLNQDIKFSATSDNINGIGQPATSYKYYVQKGDASYELLSGDHYQFTETGTYTVRVRALDSENTNKAQQEQTVEVIEGNTLYYVKTNDWSQVNAYLWVGSTKNATWPGEVMTLTNATTSQNNYPVYSITYSTDYTNIIFSDINDDSDKTSNQTINLETPYFYEYAWYATLGDCDNPLITNFYLAGSFNDWSPTANRFMKAQAEDTEASVTIPISAYSNITFKVVEDGGWCGASATLTKDENTVTIADKGSGVNIGLTPYAAGDYIFKLNLENRLLTVTYPDGEQMEIPTNIFLACDVLNNWAEANENYKFDVDEENDEATFSVTLNEETNYAFKLVYNDAWFGANYNFNYYWNTDVLFTSGGATANLYAFKEGTYTFRFKLSTSELTIDFPNTSATSVAISSYEYATLYSDIAFDVPEEVEAYIITGNDGIKLTMEHIRRIPAQTGVLLHAAEGSYDFYEGDERYMGVDVSSNKMKGSTTDELIDNSAVHYVLSYDEANKVGLFWPYGTGANAGVGAFTNSAGKAYLELSEQSAGVMARRGFMLTGQDESYTVAPAVTLMDEQGKFIRDGQLFIMHQGKLYNAQGVCVQ